MRGGTSLDTMRASTPSNRIPRRPRSEAHVAPISSAERWGSVAIRQLARSTSPSKTPSTVCVFPMSAAISKLQTLPELPHAARVRAGQKLSDRTASRNIHIGREVREPLEVERPQGTRMRYDEVRPFYDFLAEEQHVYVYRAWGLPPRCPTLAA